MINLNNFDRSARCVDKDVDSGVLVTCATASDDRANCVIKGEGHKYYIEIQNCRTTSIEFDASVEIQAGSIEFNSGSTCSFEGFIEAGEPGGWIRNRQPAVEQRAEDLRPSAEPDITERITSSVESTILNEELENVNDSNVDLDICVNIK